MNGLPLPVRAVQTPASHCFSRAAREQAYRQSVQTLEHDARDQVTLSSVCQAGRRDDVCMFEMSRRPHPSKLQQLKEQTLKHEHEKKHQKLLCVQAKELQMSIQGTAHRDGDLALMMCKSL